MNYNDKQKSKDWLDRTHNTDLLNIDENKFDQVAVVQWELTFVEHAAMRAMLPKDVLGRFLNGPFQYEELRNRVSAYVREKLAGRNANGGALPVDIGQVDKSEGEDADVNAVQQRRLQDRSNQKHKQDSDSERKPLNRRTPNLSPSASRQSTSRDKKPGSDEMKPGYGKEEASHLLQMWWKGPSCQTLPIS